MINSHCILFKCILNLNPHYDGLSADKPWEKITWVQGEKVDLLNEHLHHLFQWVVQLKFPELSSFIYSAKLELVLVKYKKENLLCFLFLLFTRDGIKMHAELYFSLREIIPMVSHCQKYAEQIFKFFPLSCMCH